MQRRELIKAIAATGVLSQAGSAWAQSQQPDILFISVDDLNDWVNPFDGPKPVAQTITPSILALAQTSTVFHRAFAPSIICGAARSAVLSGMAPHKTGVLNNENIFEPRITPSQQGYEGPLLQNHQGSIAKWLQLAGYRTGLCGKVYHGAGYNDTHPLWPAPGFLEPVWNAYLNVNNDEAAIDLANRCPAPPNNADISTYARPYCGNESMLPDVLVKNWATDQLKNTSALQPLFLALGFQKPHASWQISQTHFDAFPLASISIPDRAVETNLSTGDPAIACLSLKRGGNDPTATNWSDSMRRATQGYLAGIRSTDALIGEVFAASTARRAATGRRQVIVLWSDHGFVLGTRRGFLKTKFYERAARVPLLIYDSARNLTATQNVATPVSTQDLFPTLLELGVVGNGSGQLNSGLVDGTSLMPFVNGGGNAEQDILTSFNFRQMWVADTGNADECAAARGLIAPRRTAHLSRRAGASFSLRWRDPEDGQVWRYTWYYQTNLFERVPTSAVPIPNEELTMVNAITLEDGPNLLVGPNAGSYEGMRALLKGKIEQRIGQPPLT